MNVKPRFSLQVPPPIFFFVNMYQRLFFVLHIYCQVRCPKNRGQTEKKVSLRWKKYGMYWLCKLSLKILSGIAPKCQTVWI